MRVAHRWPVHPAPLPGEALSSWLLRIADRYGAGMEDLAFDLGYALDCAEDLDIWPPCGFARGLAGRTGVDVFRIRRMSLSGWAPWLLDQMEPDPEAFTTYTRQFSVLLPEGKRRSREVPGWRAWLPSEPALRACPQCVATTDAPHPYQLLWFLPLMLTCRFHECLLEPRTTGPRYFTDWERRPPDPRPASEPVLSMDRRTWHAMATGSVNLPRRQVHAAVWFRLVRTIIDELGTSISECITPGRLIRRFWNEIGHPGWAGKLKWHPHEGYPLDVQLSLLEGAAIAIHGLESKILTGPGAQAVLFLDPVPNTPVLRDGL